MHFIAPKNIDKITDGEDQQDNDFCCMDIIAEIFEAFQSAEIEYCEGYK